MFRKNKSIKFSTLIIVSILILAQSMCVYATSDNLSSWTEKSKIKENIENFVKEVIEKEVPVEERIAVFDMDGTIICEKPLWLEMNVAQTHMFRKTETDPTLISEPLYEIAYNYGLDPNKENFQAIEDNVQKILLESYKDVIQEKYVLEVEKFIKETQNPDYEIALKDTFYKPMIELIEYLMDNEFSVYIVSGSEEGLIWGVSNGNLSLNRDQLIGTRIMLKPDYERAGILVRGDDFYPPTNLNDGKTENIYYEIGRMPIFACGNTVDDFGMLSYASSNMTNPHISLLVNHDDDKREYKYNINDRHEKIDWEASVRDKNWQVISMKNDFETIFMDSKSNEK